MTDPNPLSQRAAAASERARRAASHATVWATVAVGLSSFSLGFALRGLLGA